MIEFIIRNNSNGPLNSVEDFLKILFTIKKNTEIIRKEPPINSRGKFL